MAQSDIRHGWGECCHQEQPHCFSLKQKPNVYVSVDYPSFTYLNLPFPYNGQKQVRKLVKNKFVLDAFFSWIYGATTNSIKLYTSCSSREYYSIKSSQLLMVHLNKCAISITYCYTHFDTSTFRSLLKINTSDLLTVSFSSKVKPTIREDLASPCPISILYPVHNLN